MKLTVQTSSMDFITYAKGSQSANTVGETAARGEQAKFQADESILEKCKQDIYDGKFTPIEMPEELSVMPSEDGKKIVANQWDGLIVETYDPGKITAWDANRSAAKGEATHGFLYQDTDFLLKAAKKYATLEDDEDFRFRDIQDEWFVKDTLDFFTGGNYTTDDVEKVQEQMTSAVRELAKQIKNGGEPDISKLETKLTIGGVDVTISQLTKLQAVGKDLQQTAFDNLSVGTFQMGQYGKIGLAQAIGASYGGSQGEIGKLFSNAVDRLAEKATEKIQREFNRPPYNGRPWTEWETAGMKLGLEITDLFSRMDTSSKTDLSNDFASTLSTVQKQVTDYCAQYGVPTYSIGLAKDVAELSNLFRSWMEKY